MVPRGRSLHSLQLIGNQMLPFNSFDRTFFYLPTSGPQVPGTS